MENEPINWTNDELAKFIKQSLPQFYEAVLDPGAEAIIMHQDAFAADMQSHEFFLLGAAIKFAGNYKKEVRVIGTNRETLKSDVDV
jgi:hypothetical protein